MACFAARDRQSVAIPAQAVCTVSGRWEQAQTQQTRKTRSNQAGIVQCWRAAGGGVRVKRRERVRAAPSVRYMLFRSQRHDGASGAWSAGRPGADKAPAARLWPVMGALHGLRAAAMANAALAAGRGRGTAVYGGKGPAPRPRRPCWLQRCMCKARLACVAPR